MYCRMIHGVYLRSNGEMACYCGPGEEIVLGQLPVDTYIFDFVKDYYKNNKHEHVRLSLSNGVLPYPGVCLKCIYLEPHVVPHEESQFKKIEWMHIEATSQCNLNCRYCIPIQDRKTYRKRPFFLPTRMFERIIEDIALHGMSVKWMYFSGRGEPGIHKETWDMVKLAKERLNTDFLVNTNGNIPYSDLIVDSGLDKIKIAIDGPDQEVYGAYRRGGELQKILYLTRRISEHKRASGMTTPKIIWQYILFDHNDSDECLVKIQEIGMDLGVDEILFKSTFTHHFSSRPLSNIPRIHPNIKFLDVQGMVTTSTGELDEKLIRLIECEQIEDWERAVPLGIEIAQKIFRSFILGVKRKQLYNRYGKSDDLAIMLDMARCHRQEYGPFLGRLRFCFQKLAKAYDLTQKPEASGFYRRFEEKLRESQIPSWSVQQTRN